MEQMSMFDLGLVNRDAVNKAAPQIEIVKAQFIATEDSDWEKLFEGFDELYAITFSSGIDFASEVVKKFSYAEIIFGCEEVINQGFATIMAVQQALVEQLAKRKSAVELAGLIEDGRIRLYVSRDVKSHEKVFCLRSKDGRVRIITGSANLSASAFCGFQRENIICFDDENAFNWYKKRFDTFREKCSDSVTHKAFTATIDDGDYLSSNPEEVPVLKTMAQKDVIFLEEPTEDDLDEGIIVANIKGHENEIKPMLPKPKKEQGKLIFTSENIRTFAKKRTEVSGEKKNREKHLPKLHLDYETQRLSFNGKECNLNPPPESIRNDIHFLFSFMKSFDSFCGDVLEAQRDYFAFMNWYFASIFMPYLRYLAKMHFYNVEQQFPVVGIIYGESNGGKSTFVRLLSKMMCNARIEQNFSDDFTATNIGNLKRACEGIPIFIDDLDKTQFTNNSGKIIKDDEWGIADRFINYPAIVITTNELPALKDYISKRAIGCRISIRVEKEIGIHNAKKINESFKKVSNSFFCEYVRRMLDRVSEMKNNMMEDRDDYFPDIFRVSSETIIEIMKEYAEVEIPKYVRVVSYSDYFGERVVGKNAIQKIVTAWDNEPRQFRVDKKKNRLIYTYPETANLYELRYIRDELPPKLNASVNARSLSMDLKAAEEFFNKRFRKKLFGKT